MSQWFEIAKARAAEAASTPLRSDAIERLAVTRWPTRKTEAWKYTSLYALNDVNYPLATGGASETHLQIPNLEATYIRFDGQEWHVEGELPKGVSLSSARLNGRIKPNHHLFGNINDALAAQSLNLQVAAGATVSQPIVLSVAALENQEQHAAATVTIGDGAELTLIEMATGQGDGITTQFAEYHVGEGATFNHYRFALQHVPHFFFGGTHIRLEEKSTLNSFVMGFGAQIARLDVDIDHAGSFANANMDCIYLLRDKEHFDLHTTIEHSVANGTSEENVRVIAADQAKATFNGRIHIHRDAQKTLAEMNNRNLLLSRNAEINTKPELEIYADDVKCAHGATVAEMDEKSLYYLVSRGIPRKQAEIMLNFGFINELVDKIDDDAIASWIREQLVTKFNLMTGEL